VSAEVRGEWPFVLPEVLNDWTTVRVDGFSAPIPACVYEGSQLGGGVPFSGLGTGYFTLEGQGKPGFCSIFNELVPPARVFREWLTVESGTKCVPLSTAQIRYLGHFPVADLQAALAELPALTRSFGNFFAVRQAILEMQPHGILEIRHGSPLAVTALECWAGNPRDCARHSALQVPPRLLLPALTTSPAHGECRQPDQQSHTENAKQG